MKVLFLSIAVLLALPVLASDPVGVNSQISDVTVYLQGAQVSREARISIPKGNSTFIFRNLPVGIDPQSIQAGGEGKFVILSILHQVNYLAGPHNLPAVKLLQDTLKMLQQKQAQMNGKIAVLKGEEEMLNLNRDLGGKDKTVTMVELKAAADFYRMRMGEIKMAQIKLTTELTDLEKKIVDLRNQLNQANVDNPVSEVLVNVMAETNTTALLNISYIVNDAGWSPEYDIRATDIQKPVDLVYNARVWQNTGEDWNKVNIRLSTANTQLRGEKPNLQPWFIDFEHAVPLPAQYNQLYKSAPVMEDKAEEEPAVVGYAAEAPSSAARLTTVNENQTNLEFVIKVPYDVPSDNKQYTINIQESTLPATYQYYCAPKLDRDAFLLARITGWENLNLLPGDANLFFEGTYVGKSSINIRNTNDTLDLSLGRDKGIVVTRVKLKDYTSQKTIGSNIRETRTWEITVRNNKKQPVNLRVEDQLPVSMNKDIEIESQEYTGASFNKETGLVVWKFTSQPAEEKKLRLSFGIKYPKDKRIYID